MSTYTDCGDDSTGYDSTDYGSGTTISFDSDGDGFAESTAYDVDGDGIADAVEEYDPTTGADEISIDSDGDGRFDTMVADTDGDGTYESGSVDTDHDGLFDTVFDPMTGLELDPTDPTTDTPFAPNDDEVHGSPMAEVDYHQAQASDNDCLPTSIAMVLSEATGTEVAASDVVDLANSFELLGPDGMALEGGVTLLEQYGMDAEVQTGTLDDLRAMLDADRPVIIGLDADDLYGAGDAPFADDMVSGHAVVITGIDDETGMVYINDPGFVDGAGVAIPISEFEDAWTDFGHQLIVADGPAVDDTSDVTVADDAPFATSFDGAIETTTPSEELPDLAIIPFALKLF